LFNPFNGVLKPELPFLIFKPVHGKGSVFGWMGVNPDKDGCI
jgi:hypothetical protein